MPIWDNTYAWRRDLPHMQKFGKTYFITFCTRDRTELTPANRYEVLATSVWGHKKQYWLITVTVMPDHVHLLLMPYEDFSLPRIMQRIKSVSAHRIGQGVLWQREYFDRILRSDEDVQKKAEYISENPVRAGLVQSADDYPWTWNVWKHGTRETTDCGAPAAPPVMSEALREEGGLSPAIQEALREEGGLPPARPPVPH
jgi:REP-associated tyrosine transposase